MTAANFACIAGIALGVIAGYIVMWALCKMSARADEQNEAMNEWNKRIQK